MSEINYLGKGILSCPECHGAKTVKCEKCNGHGKFSTCNNCNSTGKVECDYCNGTGKDWNRCPVCEGNNRGEVKKTRWINCNRCHGNGVDAHGHSCGKCNGRGQVLDEYYEKCPHCHGVKHIPIDKPCPDCNGTLEVKCYRCDGTGHAKCDACNGSGEVKCVKCGGDGHIVVDDSTSVKLMQEAASDGNLRALHDLAVAYALGQCGLAVDCGKAEECFREILKHEDDEEYDYYADSVEGHLKFLSAICDGDAYSMRELADWFSEEEMESRGIEGSPMIDGVNPDKFWNEMAQAVETARIDASAKKATKNNISAQDKQPSHKSAKKRWKFVVVGLLFGFLGLHLAYAKRWFLFLLLWAGFITGGSFYKGSAAEQQPEGAIQQVQQSGQTKSNDDMIGGIGFGIWALLWIGGTLFIKKDGKGNRM